MFVFPKPFRCDSAGAFLLQKLSNFGVKMQRFPKELYIYIREAKISRYF